MAKKITIDIEVNGKMQKATVSAKKLRTALDDVDKGQKKVGKSAGETDRRVKGAAQATANGTKEFAKMSQGMGGLVGIYATIAAQVFAVTAAFQFLRNAMEFSNLVAGQEALAATTGIAYKTMTGAIQEATNAQLGYQAAAQAAAIGTASGLSASQLEGLAKAAKNASVVLGRDLSDSFDRLIRGTTKAEPELLDELGIVLRLAPATEKYAVAIGKAAGDLTAFERSQAVANEVLEQAERKFGDVEKRIDPTTASLNQFFKAFEDIKNTIQTTIAGPIAAIASFLSDNIVALTGVLALFATSIARLLLPNIADWRASSVATIEENKIRLAELRASLDATRMKYNALSVSEGDALKRGYSLMGAKKAPTSGAGAFLAGNVTGGRARAAADKALKHSENQLKNGIKTRTGLLKDFSKTEITELRRTYNIRAGLLKAGDLDFKQSMEARKLEAKMFGLEVETQGQKASGAFARVSGGIAKAVGVVGRLVTAFSLLGLAFSVVTTIFGFFNKANEEVEKMNKELDKATEKFKTLNNELKLASTYREGFVDIGSAASGKAGSVISLDIESTIKKMKLLENETAQSAKGFDNFKTALGVTAEEAFKLDERFKPLLDAQQEGRALRVDEIKQVRQVANEYGNLYNAFNQGKQMTDATNGAVSKLIGNLQKPFGSEALNSISAELNNISTTSVTLGEELSALKDKEPKLTTLNTGVAMFNDELVKFDDNGKALTDGAKKFVEAQKAHTTAVEESNEELIEQGKRKQYLLKLQKNLNAAVIKIKNLRNNENTALLEAAKMKTAGITLDQKQANIDAARKEETVSTNKLKEKQALLDAQIKTILDEVGQDEKLLSEEKKGQLATARLAYTQTEADINLQNEANRLAELSRKIEERKLEFQKVLNKLKEEEIAKQIALNEAALREKRIRAGLGGQFGFNQAGAAAEAQAQRLQQNINTAMQAEKAAIASAAEAADAYSSGQGTRSGALSAIQGMTSSINARRQAELELEIFNDRGNALVRELQTQLELTNARRAALSLNPIEQKYQEFLINVKSKGIVLTEQQKSAVRALIEEQEIANRLLAAQKDIYKSIEQGMTSAFTSIIDGTKSVKEAFLNMGQMILQVIARVIAEMIALKIIQTIVGIGSVSSSAPIQYNNAGSAVVTPGGQGGAGPGGRFFRYGGIASEGYSTGGVAKGPQAGYPAMLHGTEAIVPLPNGKSIPVDMKGAGQQNNVVVNVSVDNQGNATQDTQSSNNDAGKLGTMIAGAVQKELQNQKRAGGILSPMGVS